MPEPCCTANRANGQPCEATPLPNRPFCLFHDPDRREALAASRSKGGATPRRACRLPVILDHLHIAQLLSELLVDAVNNAGPSDPRCLQAVTGLARVLLKAVGTPNTFLLHEDRSEPPADGDH